MGKTHNDWEKKSNGDDGKLTDKTRELIYLADKLHKEKNEVEFQKIAVELVDHQRFIDEGSIKDRELDKDRMSASHTLFQSNVPPIFLRMFALHVL